MNPSFQGMIGCGHCGKEGCRLCWLYANSPIYRWHWDGRQGKKPQNRRSVRQPSPPRDACKHRGELLEVIEPVGCACKVKIYECRYEAMPQETCYARRGNWFAGVQDHACCLTCPFKDT